MEDFINMSFFPNKRGAFFNAPLCLFNMAVVADVVFTVAVVAVATGAIPEFQLGVTHIRSTAHRTTVGIWCSGPVDGCLIRAGGGEGYGSGFFLRLIFIKSAEIYLP